MKFIPCEPGSQEWIEARLGIPTASRFDSIITPKTLKASTQAARYLNELLVEWASGEQAISADTQWMERGRELEPEAVRWYEMAYDVDTQLGGFCLRDDEIAGCSPDRLIGDDGGLEIKCPTAVVHVGYLLNGFDDYRMQVQGSLWVTGRKWWDLVSYCPGWPGVRVHCERDEEVIDLLNAAVPTFSAALDVGRERLRELGVVPRAELHERIKAERSGKLMDVLGLNE